MLRSTTLYRNSAHVATVASATRPYCGLVLNTRALAVSKLGCTDLIFVEPGAKSTGSITETCS